MIKILKKNFSIDEYYEKIKSNENGAISFFLGTVRQDLFDNETNKIESIFLECYRDLAIKQLEQIRKEALKTWKLNNCLIIHREGSINIGEKIVLVMTSSSHREDSIRSNEFIIDRLKVEAAFWKFKILKNQSKIIEQKEKDIEKSLKWSDIVNEE
ncbi:MAG: hypothetical protein CMI90_03395 [Pelagibacteraceae bacterium]|nr:hypothetical protein [Pelagibacteraceae bacterium]|tara:strand:- start:2451 stop:2918 length:468 start_codon:yes stop_codon:yes gene_type:complete